MDALTVGGKMQIHIPETGVSVMIRMSELRNWEPERIRRFFDGVAQILRAVRRDA